VTRAALALLGAGFLVITFGPQPFSGAEHTDLPVYAYYADLMLHGDVPYRDFGFEYPPLAAPLLLLGAVAGTGADEYKIAFAGLTFLLACGVVVLVGAVASRTGGDRRVALPAAAFALLLCGALIRTRFDLAPVALTLAALVLLCADRPRVAFAVLGLGALTKGFPLVVAPVALAWLVTRGERRVAVQGAAVLVATLAAIGGAAWAVSPSGFEDSLEYHLDRPAQVESSPAVVLTALEAAGIGEARPEKSFGSAGIRHPQSRLVLGLFTGLLAGVVALLAGAMTLGRGGAPGPRELVLASLAAVAAFAVLGKVLSPQFMIWVAPLTALAAAWRMYPLAATLAAAQFLTLVEYPALYGNLERNEHPAMLVVGLRNAVLFAALALAIRSLVGPARGVARWRWPGRLRRPRPAPR
jgi:uncharacterized membrane protein